VGGDPGKVLGDGPERRPPDAELGRRARIEHEVLRRLGHGRERDPSRVDGDGTRRGVPPAEGLDARERRQHRASVGACHRHDGQLLRLVDAAAVVVEPLLPRDRDERDQQARGAQGVDDLVLGQPARAEADQGLEEARVGRAVVACVGRVVVVEGASREGPPGAVGRVRGLVAEAHDTDATSSAAARVKAPE
jgi:hypothetical protein